MGLNHLHYDSDVVAVWTFDLHVRMKTQRKDGQESRLALLPLIAIRVGNELHYPSEVFSWSFNLTQTNRWTYEAIHQAVVIVANMFVYYYACGQPRLDTPNDAESLGYSFLLDAVTASHEYAEPGVSQKTAAIYFRAIRDFAAHCSTLDTASVFGGAFRGGTYLFSERVRRVPNTGFFAHLASHRERAEQLLPPMATLPRAIKKAAGPSQRSALKSTTSLTTEEISFLIDRESNPTFKGAWLLLAGTGCRSSETLNLWQCDLLPGSALKTIAGFDMEHPLVMFCHPSDSTYTGDFDDLTPKKRRRNRVIPADRRDYLERLLLSPRPDTTKKGTRAGNKGMVYYLNCLASWGYWINDKWAKQFEELLPELNHILWRAGDGAKHPYFLVNAVNDKHFGEPLNKGNLEETFASRVRKAGLGEAEGGTPHGLRHHYVLTARNLNLSRETIQIMIRQSDLESQDFYGRDTSTAYAHMSDAKSRVERDLGTRIKIAHSEITGARS